MDIQKIQDRLKDYQEHEKQLLTAGPSRATMIELSQQIIQENYLDDVTNLLSIISQQTAEIEQLRSALDMIGIHNGTIDAFNEIEKILEGR